MIGLIVELYNGLKLAGLAFLDLKVLGEYLNVILVIYRPTSQILIETFSIMQEDKVGAHQYH